MAFDEPAMEHQAAATTRANDDAKCAPAPGCGAVMPFRKDEAIGIIGRPQRPLKSCGEILGERLTVEPG